MQSIAIAAATPADAATIEALLIEARDWLHAQGIMQWTEPFAPIQEGEFYVARQQGQIVGAFRLVWTDEDRLWGDEVQAGYLGKLVVSRAAAGRGLGLDLLKAAGRIVASAGRSVLRLDCWAGNSRLIAYYEAAGFVRRGTGRYDNGEVALMEKGMG